MSHTIHRRRFLAFAAAITLLAGTGKSWATEGHDAPPPGFTSEMLQANGTNLHFVRGGNGPGIILIHGMPEDWTEYRAIMPRLAERFTVVAVDLPGIGRSEPAANGYDAANLAADIHALAETLDMDRPYVVGHDLGGIVTYAYVRRFPGSLRGAMVLDVPVPGIAGWDEAVAGLWHIGFIQAPGQLAEKLITGREAIYFEQDFATARFTPAQRAHYVEIYDAPQLHAAFEIYRAFPQNAEFNASQTTPNPVPLLVAVGEESPFAVHLSTFVEGYRARGMTRVEGATIPDAGHFVMADNPDVVAGLIERAAGN
jgi:pimeloyl-ACP methyl ester carboxylesterase